jgi:lipocalin-like protein
MNGWRVFGLAAVTALALASFPAGAEEPKSQKDQLVGTWRLLIDDKVNPDGTQTPNFGPNPGGILMFDGNGHYALVIARSNLPKFKSNNRSEGTADENKAVVGGSLAHFGTYAVDEAGHTLTLHIQGSTYPNWDQTLQKRHFAVLSPEDLKWENTDASGGGPILLYWKRIK